MSIERPRDRLGRPLPRGSSPDPSVPPVPDISGLADEAVVTLALELVADGLPFHAHEICETRWRSCPAEDRALWRALAQWGAAETHAARGNAEGAHRLACRALVVLDGQRDAPHAGMSGLKPVVRRCRSLA